MEEGRRKEFVEAGEENYINKTNLVFFGNLV